MKANGVNESDQFRALEANKWSLCISAVCLGVCFDVLARPAGWYSARAANSSGGGSLLWQKILRPTE